MKLPTAVQTFFDADKTASITKAPIDAFSPDAVVKDEGNTYAGHDSIATWWRSGKSEFQHTNEPLEVFEEHGLTKVKARVTGNFPTSPAVLTFAFRLKNGKISALEITP